ncbi:DUF5611 family protein [Halogeometricum borinquense]|uniref:Uncharacterized protein n=1 Tax=Halogeometricum borinquense TaxID=60847 RepID=A0A6C0UFN8_9EURY|nr:DUF5611 family protein [Halogeometricum borinquense]QIB73091.1 hypothetical protein G3I44_01615 [Halogeometricum borinquense]QIQ77509.1 DUF5611 family protein [Halogeometricum borinquense]
MKEYKMRRGETLDDRVPDMESYVEEMFGTITGTEEYKGSDLYVVDEPSNPVFERVVAGAVKYSGKKDKLAVEFTERDPTELGPDELEAAGEAVDAKNTFLLEATGRDAKSRRDSLKRSVEDDAPDY